jgi:filamentous hemagglutinin
MSSQGVKAFLATAEDVNDRLRDWGRMVVNAQQQRRYRSYMDGWTSETGAIRLFRATDRYREKGIFNATGLILSDAAQQRYMENGGDIKDALQYSQAEHQKWLNIFENENEFVQMHSKLGSELPKKYGIERTFISTSSDRNVVDIFGESIFQGDVPEDLVLPQTLPGAGESEYLIRHGSDLFTQIK